MSILINERIALILVLRLNKVSEVSKARYLKSSFNFGVFCAFDLTLNLGKKEKERTPKYTILVEIMINDNLLIRKKFERGTIL